MVGWGSESGGWERVPQNDGGAKSNTQKIAKDTGFPQHFPPPFEKLAFRPAAQEQEEEDDEPEPALLRGDPPPEVPKACRTLGSNKISILTVASQGLNVCPCRCTLSSILSSHSSS